ncbi:MAG TPA: type II toxin-antitoxin system HipA family toxin YjjJ [Polyangiaceae bacterium]|nr:type II toxin-antitoxin system HipA family toxin YjjJ [Polyangiaceae bacterium]
MAQRDAPGPEQRLLVELALLGQGAAPDLSRRLGLSQPSFSRLVAKLGERLLVTGHARNTRYAARRTVTDVGDRLPVYEISERGRAKPVATLHALLPEAWYVEKRDERVESAFYADLPYFLDQLRPAGFLGRLVPSQHPELEAPSDVRSWSATQVVRYAARFGWNLPGNLIVGDEAFERYVDYARSPPDVVPPSARTRRYDELARGVLEPTPGSSAGGEQPKFLVSRPHGVALIVKFSGAATNAVGKRTADLLVSEHLAHEVLRRHGHAASQSRLFRTRNRTFLEVERFDRTREGGRRGVVSLMTLDAEFVGRLRTWGDSVEGLVAKRIVEPAMLDAARWLELFGRLIGNGDMHGGNLSFFTDGTRVAGLTPAYDMLPTRYAPQGGNLPNEPLELGTPSPRDSATWDSASRAAEDFWRTVGRDSRISKHLRHLARANAEGVAAWRKLGVLLPASPRRPTRHSTR